MASLSFLAQSLLIFLLTLNDGVYHQLIMNLTLWIVTGGLLGMGIAYATRGEDRSNFFMSIIFGVFFIILSTYLLLPFVVDSTQVFRPLLLSLVSITGAGILFLKFKSQISSGR